jgi:uncharacterized membrane protein
MSALRVVAILAPLLAALGASAALAATSARPFPRRLAWAAAPLAALLLALAPGEAFGPCAALTAAFWALSVALFLLAEQLRLPPAAAQVASSFAAVALCVAVFAYAPIRERELRLGRDPGPSMTLFQELSPIAVLEVDVFRSDFVHRGYFYDKDIDFASYLHAPPRWTSAVVRVAGFAGFFALPAALIALARRRRPA